MASGFLFTQPSKASTWYAFTKMSLKMSPAGRPWLAKMAVSCTSCPILRTRSPRQKL